MSLMFSHDQLMELCQKHGIELWTTFAVRDDHGVPLLIKASLSDSVIACAIAREIEKGCHPETMQIVNYNNSAPPGFIGKPRFVPMPLNIERTR